MMGFMTMHFECDSYLRRNVYKPVLHQSWGIKSRYALALKNASAFYECVCMLVSLLDSELSDMQTHSSTAKRVDESS